MITNGSYMNKRRQDPCLTGGTDQEKNFGKHLSKSLRNKLLNDKIGMMASEELRNQSFR